jgi:SOS-response transcriptional repressor LexA
VKQQTVQYLISSRATSSAYAVRLASALGVNPAWLQDGIGSPFQPTVAVSARGSTTRARWVPKASSLSEVDAVLAGSFNGQSVVTSAETSDRSFAADVLGRSMAPDFAEGDEVIADPDIDPEPGDIVIAAVGDAMVIRRWRPRSVEGVSYFELVAANPDFPVISSLHDQCRVLATVVEHRRRLRRAQGS